MHRTQSQSVPPAITGVAMDTDPGEQVWGSGISGDQEGPLWGGDTGLTPELLEGVTCWNTQGHPDEQREEQQ